VQVDISKEVVVREGFAVINAYWCCCYYWIATIKGTCCEESVAATGDLSDFPWWGGEVVNKGVDGFLGEGREGEHTLGYGRRSEKGYSAAIGEFGAGVDAV
jgi:hypothetical protein